MGFAWKNFTQLSFLPFNTNLMYLKNIEKKKYRKNKTRRDEFKTEGGFAKLLVSFKNFCNDK